MEALHSAFAKNRLRLAAQNFFGVVFILKTLSFLKAMVLYFGL